MSEPFVAEIRIFAGNFAIRGWSFCDGQLLPIAQNTALFSLLGTTFGGDGRTSFALPDMRGRVPVHDGGSAGTGLTHRTLGQTGGVEEHVLTAAEVPAHTHSLRGSSANGNQATPGGNILGHALADDDPDHTYRNVAPNVNMHAGAVTSPANGHENMPPFLVVNCAIAMTGTFPSRN